MSRVIVAGSRDIQDRELVYAAMWFVQEHEGVYVSEIVCGMARGVDLLGKQWAEVRNIPVAEFPAEWDIWGKRAGPLRNRAMAKYAARDDGVLVALWDGKSRGTRNMIQTAEALGLEVHVFKPQDWSRILQLYKMEGVAAA